MSSFFVQPAFAKNPDNSTTAATAALPANVTGGNTLLCWVESYDNTKTVTVADDLGNAFMQIGGYLSQSGAGTRLSLWRLYGATAGARSVVVTPNAAAYLSVVAAEYPPLTLDAYSSNVGTTTNGTTGSIAVAGADELVIAAFNDYTGVGSNGSIWTPDAPLDLDAVAGNYNTAIGGSWILCSGVRSSALNATLLKNSSSYIGGFGASFTGSFAPAAGGGLLLPYGGLGGGIG